MTMAMHLANEPALLSAARHGNNEAFSVLVRQYRNNIYQLAFKITQNHEDAEDSLQEALLKAYCNLNTFQGDSRFYRWLVQITVNEALMKLRKRRSNRQLPLEDVVAPGVENPAPRAFEDKRPNPETQYAEVEPRTARSNALKSVSPRLSNAFVLRNVEDFTVKQTADRLGLSVAAVKSRPVRARGRLRQRLRKTASGGSLELRGLPRPKQERRGSPVRGSTDRVPPFAAAQVCYRPVRLLMQPSSFRGSRQSDCSAAPGPSG
jgi:RNA polymerase sigma-70 factor (ECF subfamily)